MVRATRFLCILVPALLVAETAQSAVTVMGNTVAKSCYDYAKKGRDDLFALSTCDQALKEASILGRDYAATFVNRGIIRMRRKDFDGAMSDYARAKLIQPKLGDIFANEAVVYLFTSRPKDALTALNTALEYGSTEPHSVYYNRGVAYRFLGDAPKAYYDFKKALELKPDWDMPTKQLADFTVTSN
jgi:tetratricopeptide (TPR) repeat protein